MTNYIEEQKIKCKLLTPIHISDGYEGELIPTEYVITDSGEFHKIDLARLITKIPENRLIELNRFLEYEDIIGIRNFVKLLWIENQDIFSNCIQYSMNAGDLYEYYNNLQNENKASQFIVTPFIRSNKRIFIPGSSIKGAIRTAIINELLGSSIYYPLNKPNIKKEAEKLEGKMLRYSEWDYKQKQLNINVSKDPFKALKISDTFVPSDKSMIKKVRIVKKTDEGKLSVTVMEDTKIYAEFLQKDVEICIDVRLDSRFFNYSKYIGKRISIKEVANLCKVFYKRVLEHERDNYFRSFDKEIKKSKISELYDEFITLNENSESFLLRIGKYSGRNSLSFNLKNKNGVEPKSRKLILEDNEYWPAGWVCMTMV